MDQRQVYVYPYRGYTGITAGPSIKAEVIPLLERQSWANIWLLEQFLDWLDGGPVMKTNVEANLQSVALVEAAVRSSAEGMPVAVQELIN